MSVLVITLPRHCVAKLTAQHAWAAWHSTNFFRHLRSHLLRFRQNGEAWTTPTPPHSLSRFCLSYDLEIANGVGSGREGFRNSPLAASFPCEEICYCDGILTRTSLFACYCRGAVLLLREPPPPPTPPFEVLQLILVSFQCEEQTHQSNCGSWEENLGNGKRGRLRKGSFHCMDLQCL